MIDQTRRPELLHERTLADRFAVLKLILAMVNFVVIGLDWIAPVNGTPRGETFALWVAAGFLAYMLISWAAIRAEWVSLRVYQRILPLTDVLAASMLIFATGGYDSPFNLWLAISIVSAGFGSAGAVPILTACLAVFAQFLIATVPQPQPIDPGAFLVQTLYLFGVASLVASISSHLIRQSKALAALARFGQELASVYTAPTAMALFEQRLQTELNAESVKAVLGEVPAGWVPITNGEFPVGACLISRKERLSDQELHLLSLLADRLISSIKRIELGEELVAAAAREERQRYADELHDTHLQTLAAVDMQAETASRLVKGGAAHDELKAIKTTVREAAAKTRAFISSIDEQPQGGPVLIEQIIRERWSGAEVQIAEGLDLTEGQWRAVTMMVQEGLNNAKAHGRSEHVRFDLSCDSDNI
ncbi:MAG: sensor histidine kinase, partial [Fimbriimonas sp.]